MRVFILLIILLFPYDLLARTVEYEFVIDQTTVNFTGKDVQALTVAGGIPAPTIEAKMGDILRVTFHNKLSVDSSIHWHGILLPNEQDGVPYLTTQPIAAHSSFTYEFPVIHSGTYWYHSHSGLQEQRGVYGSIVFHPKNGEKTKYNHDKVVVLSDWTNEMPTEVLRNLKRDPDYYAIKKNSVQSWGKVLSYGKTAIKNRINSSWIRMGPMDISDVGYDAFLINGKQQSYMNEAKAGQTIRLRLINASASSYQIVEFAGGEMTIIAADGLNVQPTKTKKLRVAIAETYDVLVTMPSDASSYELRSSSEDGTGYASLWLGSGKKVAASKLTPPNPFAMDHSMHDGHSMSMSDDGMMNEYEKLKSLEPSTLPANRPRRKVNLTLTGSMERYVWTFNNKSLSAADKILVKKGENVTFTFKNTTMMHHPLHLHGHFFRVLNGQDEYSPLKHTVNVPPMQTVQIEFAADEEKDWFFHCHNLYHMMSGMARVISYDDENSPTREYGYNALLRNHRDPWFWFGEVAPQSNMIEGEVMGRNTNYDIKLGFEHNYENEYDYEATIERRFGNFLGVYAGGLIEREEDEDEREATIIAGIRYTLPLLIDADLQFNNHGDVELELESELQLTERTSFMWEANTEKEYHFELSYELNKQASLVANYDSNFGAGAGLHLSF